MSPLNRILKSIDDFNDFVGRKISYLALFLFVLLLMEVTRRYLFNSPTVWANELVQMIFGAYIVLSGGHILRWGGHVNVDIIYSKLPPRARALADVLTSSMLFLFCGTLLYYGGSLAWESLTGWEHSESAWNPPLYPVKIMIPIAALLILLQGLTKLIRDITVLVGRDGVETDDTPEKETL